MVAYSFKRQTIREGSMGPDGIARSAKGKKHAQVGQVVQLYTGMRTKSCELIGTAICEGVVPVTLRFNPNGIRVEVNGRKIGGKNLLAFAQADGFDTPKDMHDFWMAEHGMGAKWSGVVIYWAPLASR